MLTTFFIKQGDLRKVLNATLQYLDDKGKVQEVADITGSTVYFSMKNRETGAVVIDMAPAMIVEAMDGLVLYEWIDGDTDVPGKYLGEFTVAWEGGEEAETFPNQAEGFPIKITPRIGTLV